MYAALAVFDAPLTELVEADLLEPELVFQISIAPNRIDLLTDVSGVTFDEAWPRRTYVSVAGLNVPVIGRADFIANKRPEAS